MMVTSGSSGVWWERRLLVLSLSSRGGAAASPRVQSESRSDMSDSVTPWSIQSREFSRPEYWSR